MAARWWASHMRAQDLSQTEVAAFERAVKAGILARCEGHWYPSEPLRGSGFRSILNDMTTDSILIEAAHAVRIRDIRMRLPQAVVWVNPGSVRAKIEDERTTEDVYVSSSCSNVSNAGTEEDL